MYQGPRDRSPCVAYAPPSAVCVPQNRSGTAVSEYGGDLFQDPDGDELDDPKGGAIERADRPDPAGLEIAPARPNGPQDRTSPIHRPDPAGRVIASARPNGPRDHTGPTQR